MSYETAFLIKDLSPSASALLVPCRDPDHPRTHCDHITTIAAWHRRFDLSGQPKNTSYSERKLQVWKEALPDLLDNPGQDFDSFDQLPEELKQKVAGTPYPGYISNIFMHVHDAVKLTTSPMPTDR